MRGRTAPDVSESLQEGDLRQPIVHGHGGLHADAHLLRYFDELLYAPQPVVVALVHGAHVADVQHAQHRHERARLQRVTGHGPKEVGEGDAVVQVGRGGGVGHGGEAERGQETEGAERHARRLRPDDGHHFGHVDGLRWRIGKGRNRLERGLFLIRFCQTRDSAGGTEHDTEQQEATAYKCCSH